MSELISASEAANKWGITARRVQILCSGNRIFGARKIGNTWMLPESTPKPIDGRSTRYKSSCHGIPQGRELTSIDLFSGPGGLATGFRWAGIKPLIAVEWSNWTAQTYAKSHDAELLDLAQVQEDPDALKPFLVKSDRPILIHGDINQVSNELVSVLLKKRYGLDSVDIVTGGAPCESFSMAGDRKEVDDRNQLYQNILRIARGVNAKMFMFENVKGLFSKKADGKKGAMYQAICDEFEEDRHDGSPAYRLAARDKDTVLLKAIDYGVPQARERLFLVGMNNAYPELEFSYPEPTNGPGRDFAYVTVADALGDLPKVASGQLATKYLGDDKAIDPKTACGNYLRRMRGDLTMPPEHINFQCDEVTYQKGPGHTERMLARFGMICQGESMRTAYERLLQDHTEAELAAYFPKRIYGARNRRLVPTEPSFTVTSHCLDEMIHPTSNRGLTPREAARLQSFPDWYVFEGPYVKFHSDPEQDLYEQIGDAIPPLLAYALACELRNSLEALEGAGQSE